MRHAAAARRLTPRACTLMLPPLYAGVISLLLMLPLPCRYASLLSRDTLFSLIFHAAAIGFFATPCHDAAATLIFR